MARKFCLLLLVTIQILFCYSQPENKLADTFIQSVAKNNFKLLDHYLVDVTVAKKLFGSEFSRLPPAKQLGTIKNNRARLMTRWSSVVKNAKKNKIDFSKLQVKQVLTGPIEGSNAVSSLLVTYEYNGIEWDDLFFIINKKGTSKYIIELPSNTAMFALNQQRRGKNVKDLRSNKDRNDPELQQKLKDAVEVLKKLVADNNTGELYSHIVYTGEVDKEKRWKRTVDPSKPDDVESAKRLLARLKNGFGNCTEVNYGYVQTEKESEGVWYMIDVTCADQTHTFAFLKINNAFVLGDMD